MTPSANDANEVDTVSFNAVNFTNPKIKQGHPKSVNIFRKRYIQKYIQYIMHIMYTQYNHTYKTIISIMTNLHFM